MKRTRIPALLLLLGACWPAAAANVTRSYSYFSVGGDTLAEIEEQLRAHGPHVQSTGERHPGATRMEFTTKIDYAETDNRCRVDDVHVSVDAKVFLPRWRNRPRAERATALIWDTLSRDIRRHEESHLRIAKRHGRRIEDAIKALRPRRDCAPLQEEAEKISAEIMAEHDAEQRHFDRVESINFERRLLRLLRYRLQQIEAGRIPG